MREPRAGPPPWLRRVLERLLRGPRGVEVLLELDREYHALRVRRGRTAAWGWYFAQLLRPDTWKLARALRRTPEADRDAGSHEGRGIRDASQGGPVAGRRGLRGLGRASGLSLDLRLAWRMLVKSPGLTVVGVLGLALGTAVGVGCFIFLSGVFYPKLPLEEGERIVAFAARDAEANRVVPPSLDDFVGWRAEMRTVEPMAAASRGTRALVTGDAEPQAVRAAEMTATGFEVARVPPLLGRYLVPDDERAGAPRVAVIGYDLWQARFEGEPGVVGRRVLVGGAEHTVVGVMPPGFSFPKSEELWTALRVDPEAGEQRGGPEVFVFGRLAPGATREQAQAELTVMGRRAAADSPETSAHLRLQVVPYTWPLDNVQDATLWDAAQIQLMVSLLLVAIAVNIAVLVYARTAMRQGEIAVRSALGASRRRIVSQLFIEALLLSILGAALGLALAHAALLQIQAIFDRMEGVGFWVDHGLQTRSVVFAAILAVLSAAIVGVLPGLRSTGRGLNADLRRLGGGASVRLGRGWTALIVIQVAIAVAVLPSALRLGFNEVRIGAVRATFAADEFLAVRLGVAVPLRPGMDGDAHRRETAVRLAERLPALERRLEAEPAVAGVTFEGRLPGRGRLVEVDGLPGPAASGGHDVLSTGVALDYARILDARVLVGRDLRASDLGSPGGGVLVSEAFVRRVLDGGPPLGERIRFPAEADPAQDGAGSPGPWLEIVGVVQDLYASALDRAVAPPYVYYPVSPAALESAELLVRVRGDHAEAFAPRLREITRSLDPDLRIGSVENLETVRNPRFIAMAVGVVLLVLATVVLLSAAGIHALMSVTITRRRNEIGVRRALGARPGRLLASVFARAAWQLGLGGCLGALPGGALLVGNGETGWQAAMVLGGVVALMLATGLAAAVGPARRGLRIQPMEALREE